ncbi:MAG: hypothetical protein RMK99_08865, partial [Anaerolineales bacterium]|nr:hypothetical protein [Anaerolineales bacterium]
ARRKAQRLRLHSFAFLARLRGSTPGTKGLASLFALFTSSRFDTQHKEGLRDTLALLASSQFRLTFLLVEPLVVENSCPFAAQKQSAGF